MSHHLEFADWIPHPVPRVFDFFSNPENLSRSQPPSPLTIPPPPRRHHTPMPHHLEFADWVPHPLPRVFDFFSNPENLPRLMAAETYTRLDRLQSIAPPPAPDGRFSPKAAGAGSILFTSFRPIPWLPLRQAWIARIVEFEWNHYFADVQQKGPFKSWHHRHEFLADTRDGIAGTLVRDVIDYEVGFGPLGALANDLFIAKQMRTMFAARQKALPTLLA